MVVGFSEVFPSINPIRIRYERLTDVIRLQNRLNKYASHKKSQTKKGNVIMRPASDKWV
ncbi:MAG: hypothetical protein MJ151_00135 [Lachnospiraceae bacterium]|nr:hypothetical protein [Lachnospiraceae bacterium]